MVQGLNESKKNHFIKRHPSLTFEQKEELISLYSRQDVPDNIIDWNIVNSFNYQYLRDTVETFLKDREDMRNLSKAIEGRDYIKIFENTNEQGTEYLYLPLTWLGSKYLASDHFLPKIKVPSKVMNARDFEESIDDNESLLPGAKWCISLWTIPDLVVDGKPLKDENGRELRHEGKKYWLWYTSEGAYFLFYFRDYSNLEDINKKIAFTLNQGSSKIEEITLADDTRGNRDSTIEGIQKYWNKHYKDYKSQIEHLKKVSQEEYLNFYRYEKQKEKEIGMKYKPLIRETLLNNHFSYNEATGRYDSKKSMDYSILRYLIEDGEFTLPMGIINGNFDCSNLELKTLRNGPTEVKKSFYCQYNFLKSLEYAPQEVGEHFNCYENKLSTLEGAPREIKGTFDCSWNQLISLKGGPHKVGGYFNCSHNKLPSLEGAPQEVKGGFNCSWNKLTSLVGSPPEVEGDFICSWNQLVSLEGAPNKVGRDFNCYENQLTTLKSSPKYVRGDFDCSNNNLISLEGTPNKIEGKFECFSNKLTNLEGAPQEVRGGFICSHNKLTSLKGAPKEIGGDFECSNNELKSLEYSPQRVGGYFDCSSNQLTSLGKAPYIVKGWFGCCYNPLKSRVLHTKVGDKVYYDLKESPFVTLYCE